MRRIPRILAFDTSTDALTVALFTGSRRSESAVHTRLRHSDIMFEILGCFLAKSGWSFRDIDLFCVGLGPGSFSGIRVGVMAAKTMAYALGKKCLGQSSLQIIAMNHVSYPKPVCVVRDARRGNVYTGTFSGGRIIRPPALQRSDVFLKHLDPRVSYTGDGLERWGGDIARACGSQALLKEKRGWYPRAIGMIPKALERWQRSDFDDCLTLKPDYLYDEKCNVTQPRRLRRRQGSWLSQDRKKERGALKSGVPLASRVSSLSD